MMGDTVGGWQQGGGHGLMLSLKKMRRKRLFILNFFPYNGFMSFHLLGVSDRLLDAVEALGYDEPTSIQQKVVPYVLQGRDVVALAQTGSGKTAAFVMPMLDMLERHRGGNRMPRALIIEPTRELAAQVQEVMAKLGCHHDLQSTLLIGGESFPLQRKALRSSPDVLIVTPGRLLDHVRRGNVMLHDIVLLVIDEADRMLDMGFLPDVREILSFVSPRRQTLLFSATMPDDILTLTQDVMADAKMVKAAPVSSASQDVKHYLTWVDERSKTRVLSRIVRRAAQTIERAIVFCNRKRDIAAVVNHLSRDLRSSGIKVAALHGDMQQKQRMEILDEFRQGSVRLLVASDVVARGIDVTEITHVFLNDVPTHAEDYIHRSGRTGRAGKQGESYTLATQEERPLVEAIEALLARGKQRFDVITKDNKQSQPQNKQKPLPSPEPQQGNDRFLPDFLLKPIE